MNSPAKKNPGYIPPGRPREFDVDEAIGVALAVFNERGYAATSLPDLIHGMGLSRGSLYKAFSNKHAMYVAALDKYMQDGLSRLKAELDRLPAAEAIHDALRQYAALSSGQQGRKGCFVVSAACEMAPHDEEVTLRVRQMFERMRQLLAEAIRRGQAEGCVAIEKDPDQLSRFLLCTIEGMRVLGKTGCQEHEMVEVAAIAAAALK
ncbi:TetR/AcrR family transcriptional regulator [Chromobacterium sp. ASV23]|uniref:TetR/AcrR family transcriptional regulator n=1 Tax=Chromobacterium sp. ASV23 TaxID=2795110 RepID=UPI0018EAC597|nr:TetR/AcrR family transcriptional regulator [Chromobacterium sp. ASV23]